MKYFFDTVDTIPPRLGFSHFDGFHLKWLAAAVLFFLASSLIYRRLGDAGRRRMRLVIAALTVTDEVFKIYLLASHGNYNVEYLPLHLCSINIFIVMLHALKPSDFWGNFLYAFSIPGALAALIFCTWTSLPPTAGMLIHSFTVHILLAAYPIMLTCGGDIRPDPKRIPGITAALGLLSVPAIIVNHFYGTNFMFLHTPQPGTPFVFFEEHCGSFLVGVPIFFVVIYAVMFLPWHIAAGRPKACRGGQRTSSSSRS